MKAHIDTRRCQGHGRCALIAPEVFDVDDSGLGVVLVEQVDEAGRADMDDAVLSCPESAIELSD